MQIVLDCLSLAAGGAAALLLLAAFVCAVVRPRWTRTLLVPGLLLCGLAIFAQLAELARLAVVMGDFAAIEDTAWARCVCGGALLVWCGGWSAAALVAAAKAEGPA